MKSPRMLLTVIVVTVLFILGWAAVAAMSDVSEQRSETLSVAALEM